MFNNNHIIDFLLQEYKPELSVNHAQYKNHVYRVFLNCLMLDSTKANEEKYAIAAVFHDIGIWTAHTIDYLPPSIEKAKSYLVETSRNGRTR